MNQLRTILFGFLGAGIFQLLMHVMPQAQAAKSSAVINASEINLVDDSGKVRIKMALVDKVAPNMWFFDDKGQPRLIMGMYQDQTSYYGLQDASGRMIQLARSFGPQESPLLIFKNRGRDEMIMGLNPSDQTPFAMYYDRARKRQLSFGKYDGP